MRIPRSWSPATVGLVASAWLLAVAVADILLPATIVPTPLTAFAAIIAAARLGVRGTSAFGVTATLFTVWSGFWNDAWSQPQQYVRLLTVVMVSGAAVAIARLRSERDDRFARMSAIAEVTQRAILPKLPSQSGPMRLASRYLSAYEDTLVGGDLYDFTVRDESTRLVVGDVRGKGLSAIEHAARVIRAFRQFGTLDVDLADAASDISAYVAQFFDDEDFATAILVESREPGRLTMVNCGHPAPVLVKRDGTVRLLETDTDLPLGLGAGYHAVEVAWEPGDRLLLYTDGLSEARSRRGEFLPLADVAAGLRVGDVEGAVERLLADVRRFVPGGRLDDDLAVVLLEHSASPTAPARPRADFALPTLPAPAG
ncbi:MAG TPA: PP2C family protein-serine/threonine phosphatase [Nocardioides sp.]|nr:PP2C family protein-serine/threonine phosphatase [Nocardioides sp.]